MSGIPAQINVKHLELIEAIIARQANNSFLVKGWALTLALAFYGFAIDRLSPGLAAVGLVPVATFWFLDSYFLQQERLFRCLYDAVRNGTSSVSPFSMDTRPYRGNADVSRRSVIWSITLRAFYGRAPTRPTRTSRERLV